MTHVECCCSASLSRPRARRLRDGAVGRAKSRAKAAAVLKASFKASGQARLDRLDQDDTQQAVQRSTPARRRRRTSPSGSRKQNLATIKWPADGKFVGDWKNGEKIAQEGRGKQYSDDPDGSGRRQLLRLPPARAAGALLRHDRPVALPVRQAARLHRRDAASTPTARSTTPRRSPRAPTCRASATTAS